jgi:hypothetical protein
MFENFKKKKEVNDIVIKKIDDEIKSEAVSDFGTFNKEYYTPAEGYKSTAKDLAELLKLRREVKLNGVDPSTIFAAIANVAIVLVMVGWEYSHLMNQKGARFIKVL